VQSSRIKAGVAGGVLLAVALAIYLPAMSVDKVERGRLASLVVPKPPAGLNPKPAAANPIVPGSSQFKAVKAAGKRSPGSTGGYSIEWTDASGSSSGTNAVSLVVSVLPGPADAAKVQDEAKSAYVSKSSLKANGYTYANSVPVPSVPGAVAAFFTPSTLTNPPLVVVAFHVGRAQATEFIGIPGDKQAIENEAVSFARSEYEHLRAVLPGFSLSTTSYPLVASVVYWLVVAVVVLAVVLGPVLRERAVERRRVLAEMARVQHKTVRGSKIAKRQAARRR